MRTIYNVLWYFPFLGFLIAIYAAIFGLVFLLLFPIGKGLFQLAKFYTAPFSFDMKRRADVYHQDQVKTYGALGVLMLLFWFPFALILGFTLAIPFLAYGATVVFLPASIVIVRSLGFVFNPINAVCVPLAKGQEVI